MHIHSNRFAKVPRFVGESWVDTVVRTPAVRVSIGDAIYEMVARRVSVEAERRAILDARGYWYAWDGIEVFKFISRDSL